MQSHLRLHINWLSLISTLVPLNCIKTSDGERSDELDQIDYVLFFDSFNLKMDSKATVSNTAIVSVPSVAHVSDSAVSEEVETDVPNNDDDKSEEFALVDAIYGQHRDLFTLFSFFDHDGNQVIEREEFRRGCKLLSQLVHDEQQNLLSGAGSKPRSHSQSSLQIRLSEKMLSHAPLSLYVSDDHCDEILDLMDIDRLGVVSSFIFNILLCLFYFILLYLLFLLIFDFSGGHERIFRVLSRQSTNSNEERGSLSATQSAS